MRSHMRSTYLIEDSGEADRLEFQRKVEAYSLKDEFHWLSPAPRAKILDAGCGSGVSTRFIKQAFPSCEVSGFDASELRVIQAREISKAQGVDLTYFNSLVEKIEAPDHCYDGVVSRYVLEHLTHPDLALAEFHRVLKPGGNVFLIDWDGILFNLHPMSSRLADLCQLLQAKLPVDINVGRKMPDMIARAGFSQISWDVSVHCFKGEQLALEKENTVQRLRYARQMITQYLGSERLFEEFQGLYLKALDVPQCVLFYNKFVVWGQKC